MGVGSVVKFFLIREMDTNSVETLFERRRKKFEIVSRRNQVDLFISEFGLSKLFFVHFMYFHQKASRILEVRHLISNISWLRQSF